VFPYGKNKTTVSTSRKNKNKRICIIFKYRNRATKERQSIANQDWAIAHPAQMRKCVLYLHRYVKSALKY
jgi:hypothetical protein